MKSILFAAAAVMIATSAASAASTASDRAGGKTAPTAQGERIPGASMEPRSDVQRVIMLRDFDNDGRAMSGPLKSGGQSGSWTGNDNLD